VTFYKESEANYLSVFSLYKPGLIVKVWLKREYLRLGKTSNDSVMRLRHGNLLLADGVAFMYLLFSA
jgi:hypothetical protein